MTVKELIEQLEQVYDKNKEVRIADEDALYDNASVKFVLNVSGSSDNRIKPGVYLTSHII